jgi:hypothetical protein
MAGEHTALGGHRPGAGLEERIEARRSRQGAGVAEGSDGEVDQAQVDRRERLVIEAQPLCRTGTEVLDDDVGPANEVVDDGLALWTASIDTEPALASVPSEKADAEAAEGIAVRRLDLDHISAKVGERHWTVGTGDEAGELQHAQSRERSGCDQR